MGIEGTAAQPGMGELAQLADELVEQIGAARRHYDDLRTALDGNEELDVTDEAAMPAADEPQLVALSMALMGGSREDARSHLYETYGIGNADDILDGAFGAGDEDPASPPAPRRWFRRTRGGRS